MTALLAFDTATETMHIGVACGDRSWLHEAAGGALASTALLPAIFGLLEQAGLRLHDLDAIAFGRGPGAFTGLRTACSVAQGLALGAGLRVLPIDTLLAVAEEARGAGGAPRLWVAMDARMNEIYAAQYQVDADGWTTLTKPMLIGVDALNQRWCDDPPELVAGNALAAFGELLHTAKARCLPDAKPRGAALLRLATAQWQRGGAVDAALALPLYVRDKVAQTTLEREKLRAEKDAAGLVS